MEAELLGFTSQNEWTKGFLQFLLKLELPKWINDMRISTSAQCCTSETAHEWTQASF